jgi:glycosyltransferase involved in cell wall biosynthesis
MLRILTLTTLFPNDAQPSHGIFVLNRLAKLVASGAVSATVVAPVAWVPAIAHRTRHGALRSVPGAARAHGIEVLHPRYPVIPRVGMSIAPWLLYAALAPLVRRLARRDPGFDVIDAHYFYPDGVAAVWLGQAVGKPVVVTGRGTDLNLIPSFAVPRRLIRRAAERAAGLITVCQALKDDLVALGLPPERITVLRNGVDLEVFRPDDRTAARARFGIAPDRRVLGSVGHLIERKGHRLAIEALAECPDTDLVIAGGGPERAALEARAAELGVGARVRFLGALAPAEVARLYAALDALVLASSREGWANVLLEAMACGTPVVATPAGGTPEVVAAPEAGVLARARDVPALVEAITRLFARPIDRAATRRYAERFAWDATTEGQIALFRSIVARADPALGRRSR